MWKKGRGKLGIFEPLIGTWTARFSSPQGEGICERYFQKVLTGKFVELNATWVFDNSQYDEIALFGPGEDKDLTFWSFTSDGKHSQGVLTDVSDVHPSAIGFKAHMPAGIARNVYWPDDENGFYWVVEAQTKKGWNRFLEHHYLPK
ncbi:MAG: hypothetical protein OEZ43_21865 [Gammaproteobacteria bacterium]|nr:hypothetical protein [Gammaproteobacteria bacterium]